jgi:hypothetical protein
MSRTRGKEKYLDKDKKKEKGDEKKKNWRKLA